jgi:hypothetical protein
MLYVLFKHVTNWRLLLTSKLRLLSPGKILQENTELEGVGISRGCPDMAEPKRHLSLYYDLIQTTFSSP